MKRESKAAYFDTSVLLKRYVQEEETDRAVALMKRHIVVTAAIAPLESISALRCLEATGLLEAKSYSAILKRIQNDRQTWDLVGLSIEILQSAERILQDLNVRCLDAIHLASACALRSRLNRPLSFITADMQQRKAASQLNLEVLSLE